MLRDSGCSYRGGCGDFDDKQGASAGGDAKGTEGGGYLVLDVS